jgi:tetratricopeptide (TPR) repeat protein
MFERVLARDPSHAPSLAGLASAMGAFYRARHDESMPPPDPRMDEAANEAYLIDPLLPQALSAMGSLRARDRRFPEAEEFFREALRRNPTLTTTYTEFVLTVLEPMGRDGEALKLLEAADDVASASLDRRRVMAMLQVDLGLYEDAIVSAKWVLDQDPVFPFAKRWRGRALMFLGRFDEAQSIFEGRGGDVGLLGYLYGKTGRRKEALDLAAEYADAPSRLMLIYGGLGDKERAFDALEKEIALGFWWRAAGWMHRPEMAVLRGDPRLDAIRMRLGLTK